MSYTNLPTAAQIKAIYFDYVIVLKPNIPENDQLELQKVVDEFESLTSIYPKTNVRTVDHEGQYIIQIDFDSDKSNHAASMMAEKYADKIDLYLVRVVDANTESIYVGTIELHKDFSDQHFSSSVKRYLDDVQNGWKLNEVLKACKSYKKQLAERN